METIRRILDFGSYRERKRQDRTTSAKSHPAAGIGNCGISRCQALTKKAIHS